MLCGMGIAKNNLHLAAALPRAQCGSALAMPGGHTNAGVYCNHTTEKTAGLISPGGW